MAKTKLFLICALMFSLAAMPVMAQEQVPQNRYRWALATDPADWACLGCINLELQYAPADHLGFLAGMNYNPFTFRRGTPQQTQMRQATPYAGVNYWFDTPFQGWYIEGKMAASVYSVANVFNSGCFEGHLAAIEFGGGWSKMLSERWRLNLGAGIVAALHDTTRYLGPVCGRIEGRNRGFAILPDVTISFNYLF